VISFIPDMNIDDVLTRGVDEIIKFDSLRDKLSSGKKLVVKLGIDPTGSKLHLGHSVVLRKLRQFQDLGHKAVLVIGDFTAKIGDPSGRTKERKSITEKQITKNMSMYTKQASKILDMNNVTFAYNSSWLADMGLQGVFELASKATVAQIFEREEFRQRYKNNIDIPYLEMLYPLMQGYDSVHLKADLELGGTDQKFNLLMGRQIQKKYGQKPQDILMVKLLVGTDGTKMSKSADNFISLTTTPQDMYGKIMSIPDNLIRDYWELTTDLPLNEVKKITNPYELKKELAREIVRIYHNKKDASLAEQNFMESFAKGNITEESMIVSKVDSGTYKLIEVPIISGATTSISMAKDLLKKNSVKLNDKIVKPQNWSDTIKLMSGDKLTVGKRRLIKVK